MFVSINRGKQFEDLIREQFEKIDNITITRLYDVTMGYKQVNNPCDLIVYKKPNILFIECKALHGNTLNFRGNIRENQWEKLLHYSKVPGVIAGVLVWFIDRDETYFIDILTLEILKKCGKKSFNASKKYYMNIIKIQGHKKKVFFDYDLEKFLEDIKDE